MSKKPLQKLSIVTEMTYVKKFFFTTIVLLVKLQFKSRICFNMNLVPDYGFHKYDEEKFWIYFLPFVSWTFCCLQDHLIKHFYFYGLALYLLPFGKVDKDKAEDNTFLSLWAIAVVLDIITFKQDAILIFYCYLGQT